MPGKREAEQCITGMCCFISGRKISVQLFCQPKNVFITWARFISIIECNILKYFGGQGRAAALIKLGKCLHEVIKQKLVEK